MNLRIFSLTALALSLSGLMGCSGSSSLPAVTPAPTTQSFGPLTTRIVGTAQTPVTSSAANGANVTAIAGALVDQLTLNFAGPGVINDTKIAFSSNKNSNTDIYVMSPNGTEVMRLTTDANQDLYPAWSPLGNKIAFCSDRTGNFEIYTMNADGTGQINVSNSTGLDSAPCWSPDGSKILFTSNRNGLTSIYVMNSDGTGQTRLTNDGNDSSPSWSPDGRRIAFISTMDSNTGEIYTMNSYGGGLKRVTTNNSTDTYVRWSPNGNKLAACLGEQVYTMNPDGTGQLNITNGVGNGYEPTWSPDGIRVAYRSNFYGGSKIFSMSAFGEDKTNLSNTSDSESTPSWSGYLPRTPKTLIGSGGTLGSVAAGFLFGLRGKLVTSVVAFETTTPASRSAARVSSQTSAETQGTNLVFNISTSAGLASISHAPLNEAGVPGAVVAPTLPTGTTNGLVAFDSLDGSVVAVLPYAANRSAGVKQERWGNQITYTGSFSALYDGRGKNLAPGGARSITLDTATGKLLHFDAKEKAL